jgi:hypothetical protein
MRFFLGINKGLHRPMKGFFGRDLACAALSAQCLKMWWCTEVLRLMGDDYLVAKVITRRSLFINS